jgi:hypothetical protein
MSAAYTTACDFEVVFRGGLVLQRVANPLAMQAVLASPAVHDVFYVQI